MASVILAGTTSTTALNLTGDTSGELQLKTNNGSTTAMTLTTAGDVGIGTSSPSYKLHVVGSGTGARARIESTSTANSQLSFVNTSTSSTGFVVGLLNDTSGDALLYHQDAKAIQFWTSSAERMRIDSSGNVGIGTSSPSSYGKFAVHGALGTGNAIVAVNTSSGSADSAMFIGSNYVDSDIQIRVSQVGAATKYASVLTGTGTPLILGTGSAERMRITSSGNVGIGTTGPSFKLQINVAAGADALNITDASSSDFQVKPGVSVGVCRVGPSAGAIAFQTDGSERMRLSSGGTFSIAKTNDDSTVNGAYFNPSAGGFFHFVVTNTTSTSSQATMYLNRQGSDGQLIDFRQADVTEGSISVSGTTVSYNGGNLSRWAQMLTKPELLKGTVMSNLDEMNEYVDAEGNPVDNEQLNKVKVSDVEGDVNAAGVFVNWSHDEVHNVDEINMAMTGDMIIRIAQGVVVQKGDLLMSAGDGTAKPQGDDIVRSKTVAKVTSNHVTCTYADGSYCVPCVLMAC